MGRKDGGTSLKGAEDDMSGDPLRGINVDAAGGAGKVLKLVAEKVGCGFAEDVVDGRPARIKRILRRSLLRPSRIRRV